jgi:hypothetical protein
MTAEAAMKPDAPILLPEIRRKFMAGHTDPRSPEGPDEPTNVAAHIRFQRGDLEAGFRDADYIVEREFKTAASAAKPPSISNRWRCCSRKRAAGRSR